MADISKKVAGARRASEECNRAASEVAELSREARKAFSKVHSPEKKSADNEAQANVEDADTWTLMEGIASGAIEARAKYPSGTLRFVALTKAVGDLGAAILSSEPASIVRRRAVEVGAIAVCLANDWNYAPKRSSGS